MVIPLSLSFNAFFLLTGMHKQIESPKHSIQGVIKNINLCLLFCAHHLAIIVLSVDKLLRIAGCQIVIYRISIKFDAKLNLANWQIITKLPNSTFFISGSDITH